MKRQAIAHGVSALAVSVALIASSSMLHAQEGIAPAAPAAISCAEARSGACRRRTSATSRSGASAVSATGPVIQIRGLSIVSLLRRASHHVER